ncbi:MAG: ribonuclease HII [Candidatus Marinimicrobia bacterium]|nr:ribonuclease HII [Candidatus Neomarinimicrobiota bacterium]
MDMLEYEKKYWSRRIEYVAGIDEAGRGPLAGPVVASAVVLPHNVNLPQVTDSKKLSEKKRERLFAEIMDVAVAVGIGIVHEKDIDEINILQATYKAMQMAVGQLVVKPEILLVDGRPADIKHFEQESIIKGDNKSLSIAAASIIAKVTRDRMMINYDKVFPTYGFAGHKGYGSQKHIESIKTDFATPIHRQSFKPISDHLPSLKYYKDIRLVGTLGEQLVACIFIKDGCEIVEMNYNVPKIGEVDIISKDDNILVFTEVKTQTKGHGWNEPHTQIDEHKRDRIMNAAQYYMDENELNIEIRFDVAEVVLGDGNPKINIIKNGLTAY